MKHYIGPYAAAGARALYLLVPLTFLCGALVGGVLVWHRARRAEDGAALRWVRVKLAAVTAVVTVVVVALSGLGFVGYRFQSERASAASVDRAVADYRQTGAGTVTAIQDAPAPGVYTFRGEGYFKIDAPIIGSKLLNLPPTIPAIVTVTPQCWEIAVRPYKQREWTERYCRNGKAGFRLEWRKNRSDMYGIQSSSRSECRPSALFDAQGTLRSAWTSVCKVVANKTNLPFNIPRAPLPVQITHLGQPTLTLGGQRVVSHHLRQTGSMKGAFRGSMTREVWYARDTGMLLKMRILGQGSGLATIKVDQTYILASLQPRR